VIDDQNTFILSKDVSTVSNRFEENEHKRQKTEQPEQFAVAVTTLWFLFEEDEG
jgi:hypothetical protein